VPVADSGISPELIDLAREAIRDNTPPSAAGRRVWELSGGIIRCGECGYNMMIHSVSSPREADKEAVSSTTAAASATATATRRAPTGSATAPMKWSRWCGSSSQGCSKNPSG
jgi:hypothetical protein